LAESTDNHLDELYEYAPCGFLSVSPEGRVIRVNETLLALTGHTRAGLLGTAFTDLLSIGSQLFYETRYLPVLHLEGAVREVALSFRRPDGGALSVLVNAVLVTDETGAHRVTRVAVFEATARQNYERELLNARRDAETSEIRVRILQNASSAFGTATTEPELAEALVESARDAFAASEVAVLMPDASGTLRVVAGRHPLEQAFLASRDRPALTTITSPNIVTMSDYSQFEDRYPGMRQELVDARVASLAVTPILGDDGPLGVYVCFFARRREFDEPMLEMQAAIARQAAQVLQRARLSAELQRLALYDQLTGLASRRLLSERLESAIESARRSRLPVALVFADLDGFKLINDSLGHTVGDQVLVQVAGRLRAELRDGDVVGRFGGDEFVAICENTDAAAALRVTERMRAGVAVPLTGAAASLGLSVSIGVAVFEPTDEPPVSAERMFTAADTAMYAAKEDGKNRISLVHV
jgi:diguanylate cyclase (GGDEF)-like protein/PAS domain S-box-containing protein